jgi:hypothetical protein
VEPFDVAPEALEIVAKVSFHTVEPPSPRFVARVDTALLDQVVLELLEDQRRQIAAGLFPVRRLPGSP